MRRQIVIVVVATTLLLAAGACTTKSLDVEAGSPSTDQRTTATEREDDTSTTRSVPSSTTTAPATPTTAGNAEGAIDAPGSRAGQCPAEAAVEDLQERFGEATGDIPPADAMSAVLDLLALYVPSDLAADFEVMRGAIMQLFAVLEAMGPDPSAPGPDQLEQLEQMGSALEAIDTPEIDAASRRIEDYFKQTCPDLDWEGKNLDPLDPTFD